MPSIINFKVIWTIIILGVSVYSCDSDPRVGMFLSLVVLIPSWVLGLVIYGYVKPNDDYRKTTFNKDNASNISKAKFLYDSLQIVFWVFAVGYIVLHFIADIPITIWGTVGALIIIGLIYSGLTRKILGRIYGVSSDEIKYFSSANIGHELKVKAQNKSNYVNYSNDFSTNNLTIKDKGREPEAYYDRGNKKHLNEDFQGAVNDYTEAIKLDPNCIKAYKNRAAAYCGVNNFEGSVRDYTKVIELSSNNKNLARAYASRADVKYLHLDDYLGAIEDYDEAIKLEPDQSRALYYYLYRGICRIQLGQQSAAFNDFRIAQDINKTVAYYYMKMYLDD